MLLKTIRTTLEELSDVLQQCGQECYVTVSTQLCGSTIGQHTRHVIELFQCLEKGYQIGTIAYDKRERNLTIETNLEVALECIGYISLQLEKENKDLKSSYELGGGSIVIETNYIRELMYNLEHCIHHQALIKLAIQELTDVKVPEHFGVAPSTISYRKACVQ